MRPHFVWTTGVVLLLASVASADAPTRVDELLARENAERKVQQAPIIDDLAFLRRVSIDLIGRIPTEQEIQRYLALPAGERRTKAIDDLLKRDQFADRWTVFFGDMLRIRSNTDGGASFLAFVHRAIDAGLPYDVMSRQLLSATGKAGLTPEVGFILGDDADPYAMAGITSQVFLGVRIACAQCHNHPFDVWKRKQFYDLAAYFGKTRKVESRIKMRLIGVYLNEAAQTTILWPPEDKAEGKKREPVNAAFPFQLEEGDGPSKHIARLNELRARLEAEAKKNKTRPLTVDDLLSEADDKLKVGKKDDFDVADEAKRAARNLDVQKDIYKASALRNELARLITDPRNRYFSRNLVNRVWGELLGKGFVNPVDDFREDNPPSHEKTLDYIADEFVASGYDFRTLVRMVVTTQAYQRAHLPQTIPPTLRQESEQAFVAASVRRMVSETMFDSIVQAGHLFSIKHRAGDNMVTVTTLVRETIDMDGKDSKDPKKKVTAKPLAMAGPAMAGGSGYDLERGIEVNFKDALRRREEISIEAMQRMSNEEIEAMQMMKDRPADGKRVKVVTREVQKVIDDNPQFGSSMRMASPAPVGHFLRVFGQTDRGALDERRDHSPSMRQALMMLNGKLTNEAARVGALEPMHALLVGDKADVNKAISLAYREILTREPSTLEREEALKIIREAGNPLDGMADLRWTLLNCHEFRFLP